MKTEINTITLSCDHAGCTNTVQIAPQPDPALRAAAAKWIHVTRGAPESGGHLATGDFYFCAEAHLVATLNGT